MGKENCTLSSAHRQQVSKSLALWCFEMMRKYWGECTHQTHYHHHPLHRKETKSTDNKRKKDKWLLKNITTQNSFQSNVKVKWSRVTQSLRLSKSNNLAHTPEADLLWRHQPNSLSQTSGRMFPVHCLPDSYNALHEGCVQRLDESAEEAHFFASVLEDDAGILALTT